MARLEIVGQRQFGIIAPEHDLNRVRRIGTGGLTACFGVILRDPKGIDFLAHLDYEQLLPETFDLALPVLERLGIENVQVTVVNIEHPEDMNDQISAEVPVQKRAAVEELANRLVRLSLAPNRQWEELGTYTGVIVEIGKEITVGNLKYEDFNPSSTQLAKLTVHQQMLHKVVYKEKPNGRFWLMKVTPAYLPLMRR